MVERNNCKEAYNCQKCTDVFVLLRETREMRQGDQEDAKL